ncbi:MAG TPA: alkaline phosphatase family protein [Terriglobales bacterium]|nr:alkaline phosphatase family protein [Terriglobales bacterium]
MVLEENHGYTDVIGNSAMPYLNSLANKYGLAAQYYAVTHPSIGNYFMLTTGQVLTNNDSFTGTVDTDNLVRHLISAGKSWKSYAENLPRPGYTGGDTNAYSEHHNPFSYFSDVRNSSNERDNLAPFSQFQSDVANHQLPDFSFVVPNLNHDAHNGSLGQADAWLRSNMAPLLASTQFKQGGLLIIVFDEAEDSDSSHGGGRVAMIVAGPGVKHGYRSSSFYRHQNLLRTIAYWVGIDPSIGSAANARPMTEFFLEK